MALVLPETRPAPGGAITVTVETVTPALAHEWLETNGLNRPLSVNTVRRYAADMNAGRWLLDGTAIRFDRDGRLLDGQHRLRACIVANASFTTVVMRGLDPDSFAVMDDGHKRTGSDVLAITGEKNTAVIAGAVRYVYAYESGRLFAKGVPRFNGWTNQLSLDMLRRHPDIRASVPFGERCHATLPPSMAVGLHYICSRKDATQADAFFSSLADGLNLSAGDPVYTLRQRLIDERAKPARLPGERQIELVVRAWNAVREGRPLMRLLLGDPSSLDII